MPEPETKPPLTGKPDIIDILAVCWGVISLVFLSEGVLTTYLGKAAYVLTEILMLVFAWGYLSARKIPCREIFRWRSVPANSWKPILTISIAAAVLLDELDRLVSFIIPMPAEQVQLLYDAFIPGGTFELVCVFLGVVIVAPIAEESIFRGFVQKTLESRGDVTKAVLITSAIFSLIHLQHYWLVQLLVLSVVLGYLAWRTGSIIPGILIHAFNNCWSLILMIKSQSGEFAFYEFHGHVNPILIVIASVFLWQGFRSLERVFNNVQLSDLYAKE